MKTSEPQERFVSDLWEVLKKIKKGLLYSGSGRHISYEIALDFLGTPPHAEDEEKLMEKLYEWDVIVLEKDEDRLSIVYDNVRLFSIRELKPKFEQLYRLCESGVKKEISSDHLFELIHELANPRGNNPDLSIEIWELTQKPKEKVERTIDGLFSPTVTNIRVIYDLSPENRSKVNRLIQLIQNQIELAGSYSPIQIELSRKLLEKEGYTINETELLIEKINDTTRESFMEVNHERRGRKIIASDIFLPGITNKPEQEKDLAIRVTSLLPLKQIKAHIEVFEKRLIGKASDAEQSIPVEEKPKPEKEGLKKDIHIENDSLCFGTKKIPFERGQKSMVDLFIKNAKVYRGDKLVSKGKEIDLIEFQRVGGYQNEAAIRNALNKLRKKLKEAEFPVTIENPQTGKYQMVIKYQ